MVVDLIEQLDEGDRAVEAARLQLLQQIMPEAGENGDALLRRNGEQLRGAPIARGVEPVGVQIIPLREDEDDPVASGARTDLDQPAEQIARAAVAGDVLLPRQLFVFAEHIGNEKRRPPSAVGVVDQADAAVDTETVEAALRVRAQDGVDIVIGRIRARRGVQQPQREADGQPPGQAGEGGMRADGFGQGGRLLSGAASCPPSDGGRDAAARGCLFQRHPLVFFLFSQAQDMVPGFGSCIKIGLRKATALVRPSSIDMRLSSCSIESTRS